MTLDGESLSTVTVKDALLTNLRESGILDVIKRTDERVARLGKAYKRQNTVVYAIEEAINNLVRLVSAMKESKVKAILQGLILALVFNFISNNFVTPLTQPFTDIPVKAIVKLYKKDVKATVASFDNDTMKQYRFVVKPGLEVRAGGKMKAYVIAKAELGQVVAIVRKNRNWTQIEYIDRNTQEYICGWVLTRYIEVFK